MTLPELQNQETEIRNSRGLTIGLLGVVGSGRTELASALGQISGEKPIRDSFEQSHYHIDFIKSPIKLSERLKERVVQLRTVNVNTIQIINPAIEMYYLYGKNLYNLHIITKKEWQSYESLFSGLLAGNNIVRPDINIVLKTGFLEIEERIKDNPIESKLLNSDPWLIKSLNILMIGKARELSSRKHTECLIIDSSHQDFVGKPEVEKRIVNQITSNINEFLIRRNYVGHDGMKITPIPKSMFS